ncbi:metallopeptidase TldD-related protein, partial [Salmonella enterica subsp. enterica serovar Virginia]|nr:metallopeptidase TldD-related protein [Salmonella enterica subsp. enterica serovar Virginia]
VFTLCWQIALGGQLGPAVATALFALSLPMQGLWWLGKRSVTPVGHGLEGDFNRRGTSVFSGQIGEQVASALCTVVDDGTMMNRR